jgi:hypothetical protein
MFKKIFYAFGQTETGIGVPKEQVQRLGERFYRVGDRVNWAEPGWVCQLLNI